jgi:hypothetical protein
MTLLTVVADACDRLGIVRPTSVVGSSDQQIRQILGLAQQEGKDLAKRFGWQRLTKEKTFTATATETQSSVIPTDYDRMLNGTFFNRTAHRYVEGPMDPVEYQRYKASTTTIIFDAFRIRGNDMLLAPTPNAGDEYAFEYISTYWVATGNAPTTLAQASWLADSDVSILPEELLTLGIVWRFRQAKGLDYGEAFRTYEAQLMLAQTRDTPHRSVHMGKSFDYRRARRPSFPDGSWNVS